MVQNHGGRGAGQEDTGKKTVTRGSGGAGDQEGAEADHSRWSRHGPESCWSKRKPEDSSLERRDRGTENTGSFNFQRELRKPCPRLGPTGLGHPWSGLLGPLETLGWAFLGQALLG